MTLSPSISTRFIAALLALVLLPSSVSMQGQQAGYEFKKDVDVVLVNVVVRDKSGAIVKGLKSEDFTVLEDNKPQTPSSFDFEEVDTLAAPPIETAGPVLSTPSTSAVQPATPAAATAAQEVDFHGHRLVVLLFDLSSMEPEEIERAADSATDYVKKQMTPADLVGVASFSTSLVVNQDFTSDRDLLIKAITALNPTAAQGFSVGSTGDTEGTPDTGQGFTPDDTEFNIFNTDRRLEAIKSLSDALAQIQQKKSVIYFSSGMSKTGIENQSQIRAAINRAVRANVSLYTMDMRGLQAIVPGGEAQQASLRGTSLYSGAATRNAFDSNFDSQETITTLANDTGGRAFLDSNDFSAIFKKVQADTSAYYVIGYRSTNPLKDGRYRRITVKCRIPNVKLEYRVGYYAPRDFAHSNRGDRDQQLVDELNSDLSSTDLDLFVSAAYFRISDTRYYVPVSLIVRGSQIPFTQAGDKDKATLDVIGVVRDEGKRVAGDARDTVKLNLDGSQVIRRKNVQYETGFYLPPGKFHVKFVIRENQNGGMGSFESDLVIPDLRKSPLKMSAIVLGAQLQPFQRKKTDNPLVRDGNELIPNITHVFSSDQKLYFYYEIYDPAREKQDATTAKPASKDDIRILSSVQFLRGKSKIYETPLVEVHELSVPDRKAAIFQLEVPLAKLAPGLYTCQVNVIDDAAGTFVFPRLSLLLRAPDNTPKPIASLPASN